MGVFVNFTNHKSQFWSDKQSQEALTYGEIIDIGFPNVDPGLNEEEILHMANRYVDKILELEPDAVLCQGEFSLVYAVVDMLKSKNITVLAACSRRRVKEKSSENGKTEKVIKFEFVRFRCYSKR